MNIALVIDSLASGGAERVVQELAAGLGRRGHGAFVYCLRSAACELDTLHAAGVTVREARSNGFDPLLGWRLGRWMRGDGIDAVHTHSSAAFVWAGPVARLLGRRVVHTLHGALLGRASRHRSLARRLFRLADQLTIVSESIRGSLPRRDRDCAVHVPNGIDRPPPSARERAQARRLLEALCGRTLPGPVILSVGTICAEKNTAALLEAAARLRRDRPDVAFVCIGDARDKCHLSGVLARRRQLALESSVFLPGPVREAYRLMAGADVFCQPSRTEAAPLAILEAMSQGTPIVATAVGHVGAIAEHRSFAPAGRRCSRATMLEHDRTAWLVPPGDVAALCDALEAALLQPREAARRAAAAQREYARRFTAGRMHNAYERLYAENRRGEIKRARDQETKSLDLSISRSLDLRASPPVGRPPRVMMVGPASPAIGGMVSAVDVLMRGPLRSGCALMRYSTNRRSAPLELTGSKPIAQPWPMRVIRGLVRHGGDAARFAASVIRSRPDIVHLHTCSGFSFHRSLVDMATARLLGRRVVLHIHGGRFAAFCRGAGPIMLRLIRLGCRTADAVVVVSRTMRNELRPMLPGARLLVVPNAVSPPPESGKRPQSRMVGATRVFRFVFLGALTPNKGVGELIAAAARLRERGVDFELVLAGPCDEAARRAWHAHASASGVLDAVHFAGPLDREDADSLLASADCLVLPSHSEAMPMVLLEAAAHGLPVIASAVGGIPEMVTSRAGSAAQAVLAALVPPGDVEALAQAMRIMAADPERAAQAGQRLAEHLGSRYGVARQASRLRRIYGALNGRRGSRVASVRSAPVAGLSRGAAVLAYRVHERLRGRATLREMGILRRAAAGGKADVLEDQRRRLRELLAFAERELPFYRRRFADAGIDAASQDPIAAMRRIEPLDKPTVRANAVEMTWAGVPGGPIAHSSGGTTGDTLHFVIDRTRQAQTLAARLFMQERFGVRLGDRRVYVWGSPIESRGGRLRRWRDRMLNEFMLDAFEMSPRQVDDHLRRLVRLRPALIYGYPSAIEQLARRALETHGRRLRRCRPRVIVLTGEEIEPRQKELIGEAFGCRVAAEYGSREVGLIAHECPRGGLHVIAPHVLVEAASTAVERASVPARPANRLEGDTTVLCTNLNTRAQPLIRYRVGDAGALLDGDCPCGLPFPLMRLDGGKVTGMIALPGGGLCHGAVTSHVLRDMPGVVQFRTHQRAIDRFDVILVVDGLFQPGSVGAIEQRYRALFGPAIRVNCRIVDRIPPEPSGKRRYVVSDVAPRAAVDGAADPWRV